MVNGEWSMVNMIIPTELTIHLDCYRLTIDNSREFVKMITPSELQFT